MIAPAFPNHDTQPARLLALLLKGRHVEPLTGWRSLGIYRLSDTAFQLRKLGWPVQTGRLDVANRFGECCHVASYSLPKSAIEAVGDDGSEYAEFEFSLMHEPRAA